MAHIEHAHLKAYAVAAVNLPSQTAKDYRAQVENLRTQLLKKIEADPDYGFVKTLQSGSVRKGTALKSTSDMDLAVYVKKADAPTENDAQLVSWMATRLREAFPQLKDEQFKEEAHCVTLTYVGSGLSVDAVPVLYDGAANNIGDLVNKHTGARVRTSVSQHLEFIRARKNAHPEHFAQVVRLAKQWVKHMKRTEGETFRFKSFMVELILAHMADNGQTFSNYPDALEAFFDYIANIGLQERISFTDFYEASKLPTGSTGAIEIFDPVNWDNNVAAQYTDTQRRKIVEAAGDAADAISEARYSDTKDRAVKRWQSVFGTTFKGNL